MSTTLERPVLLTTQGIRHAHVIDTITTPPHSRIPLTLIPILLHTKQTITRRTCATSEDRDSGIRQRRGCKTISSLAESCGAPSSLGAGHCNLLSKARRNTARENHSRHSSRSVAQQPTSAASAWPHMRSLRQRQLSMTRAPLRKLHVRACVDADAPDPSNSRMVRGCWRWRWEGRRCCEQRGELARGRGGGGGWRDSGGSVWGRRAKGMDGSCSSCSQGRKGARTHARQGAHRRSRR